MKAILFAAISLLTSLASAKEFTTVYVDVGRAPYRGVTSVDLALQNKGPADLTDIHYTISGPGFTANHNCPAALKAGKSCAITIRYWATIPGNVSGQMQLFTSDKNYMVHLYASSDEDPSRNTPRPPIPGPVRPR